MPSLSSASRSQLLQHKLNRHSTIILLKVKPSWLITMRSSNWEKFKKKRPLINPISRSIRLNKMEDSIWMIWSVIHTWLRFSNNCLRLCNKMRLWMLTSTTVRETWWEAKEDHITTSHSITGVDIMEEETCSPWITCNHKCMDNNQCQECQALDHNNQEWDSHNHRWTKCHHSQAWLKCQTCHRCQDSQDNHNNQQRWPQIRDTRVWPWSSSHQ